MNEQLGSSSGSNLDRWELPPDTNQPPLPQAADADVRARIRAARATPDAPAQRAETIEKKINPEDEQLPGNTGFLLGLWEAGEKRFDQMGLAISTGLDLPASSLASGFAAHARTQEALNNKRVIDYTKAEAYHSRALATIEARSGLWKLPVAKQVAGAQAFYHGWRERVNSRKAARADAKATRMSSKAESAEKYKGYFDGNIAAKVDKVQVKWEKKKEEVRKHLDRIDGRIAELNDAIIAHESLISKVKASVASLEQTTGGDRVKRRERLIKLYKSLASEEAALEAEREMQGRAFKHQIRLSIGHDGAESQINALETRYETHEAWGSGGGTETAPVASGQDTDTTDPMWTLRDLAESKGSLTNQQVAKIWDALFKNSKLPEGHMTLTKLSQAAFPGRQINAASDASMTIRDFLAGLKELFRASPAFVAMVQDAVQSKKKNGIDILLGRFETYLA